MKTKTFTSKVEFLRQVFGSADIARDGVNVAVKCPACSESSKKKKFSINTKTWKCHCWVCGIKGSNPYKIFKDNINNEVAEFFKSEFLQSSGFETISAIPIEDKVRIPNGFIPLFLDKKYIDPDVKSCLSYLRSRGITNRDMWYFKMGTSLSGRFRRRIIIPSFDSDGELNYFSARSIDNSNRKYINAKASKTDIIFNEINIDWDRELTITEGPFDLFKSSQNSTCILGSSFHEGTYLFKRVVANKTPVLIALDSDMNKKAVRMAELLLEYDCKVRIINLGNFKDVGEMTRSQFLKAEKHATEWNRFLSIRQRISSIRTGSLI